VDNFQFLVKNQPKTNCYIAQMKKNQKNFAQLYPMKISIGTQTGKSKISTNPGKVFPTGLYLGMGGFDHF